MKDCFVPGLALLAAIAMTALIAMAPDLAFCAFFGLLALAAPFVVVIGAVRWLLKKCKGGRRRAIPE